MQKIQSRRKFIMNSSKIIATIIGTITLGKYFSNAQAKERRIHKITMPKTIKKTVASKVLIIYESKFGSTAEIAKFIGASISENSHLTIKKVTEANNLEQYNKIIIGSAIQYDTWMPEARKFIIKNKEILIQKSVSFFLVCLVLSKNNDKAIQKVNRYATKIKNFVPNVEINHFGKFAGVLDYSKMSFGQRLLARGIFAIIGVKEGDYRDWKAIKKWSENI